MEYTTNIDGVQSKYLEDSYRQAEQEKANYLLDGSMVKFCEDLRAWDGKPEDPDLTKAQEAVDTALQATEAKQAQLVKRLSETPQANTAERAAWLDGYVAQIEATHATHALQAELAAEADDSETVESCLIAMIQIEGAHQAALEERASLNGS